MSATGRNWLQGFNRHPLLAGLDDSAKSRLVAAATPSSMVRGSMIFREGDQPCGIYLVVRGQIKLALQTGHGRERVFDLIGAGGSFGEPAMLLGQPQPATAEAVTDTELVCIGKTALLHEIRHNGQFAERVLGRLAGQLCAYMESMKGHMLLSGTQRVICFLLSNLPDGQGRRDVAITFPARKGVIASKLNLTQEHFSRILRELMSAALIEVSGPQVRIRDVERLRAFQAA